MTVKASIGGTSTVLAYGVAAPTIVAGIGAPKTTTINGANGASTGTPVAGSKYIRTDGTAGARIYWYYGGSWVAQTSP